MKLTCLGKNKNWNRDRSVLDDAHPKNPSTLALAVFSRFHPLAGGTAARAPIKYNPF